MSPLILVPLDGSKFSESTLAAAFDIARKWNADVEVVTVHEPVPTLDYDLWETASRDWSDRYIQAVGDRMKEEFGVEVRATTLAGPAQAAIQDHVVAREVDLIVMATHGRGAMSRFWLGSTTDALVRHSTVPILLMRPEEEATPSSGEPFAPGKIVVPLDGSDESEAILAHALALGGNTDVEYELVRVFPYPEDFASAYLPHTAQINAHLLQEGKAAAQEYVETQVAALKERGIRATAHTIVDSSPAAGILHFAAEMGADLIAMSTHGRGGVSRILLGSVTDKVVRGAEVPMLVYHPHDV